MYKKDLVKPGIKFGRLEVIKKSGKDNSGIDLWECLCECGKYHKVRSYHLLSGYVASCGCLRIETARKRGKNKKYNKYDLTQDFGIGYTYNNETFYFDLEDYNKIKEYSWHINDGYVIAKGLKELNRKKISFHRLILGANSLKFEIDHIDRNGLNNRKCNLRKTSHMDNCKNQTLSINNKTGITGVCIEKGKYRSDITYNKKRIFLGYYNNLEDATVARLKAEKKYFKEFAPQKHLYKEYGI